jgi:single-stranded-DNA-specific exonuclease
MDAFEPLFGVASSLGAKAWRLSDANERVISDISRRTGVNDALARLLAARGLEGNTAEAFLTPKLRDSFPDPSSFTDMDVAVRLIWDAIESGTKIGLFTDYDVDGATSAAQLFHWLKAVADPPIIYVPDRINEGYGPNTEAFKTLQGQGVELIITLDCGAASVEPLEAAQELGLSVAVIDHHLMTGERPPAAAIVNPNQPGDQSHCGHLAAAGVTFILLAALNREGRRRGALSKDSEPNLLDFLDLAALGTICDVVSLTGINRAIVSQGLKLMSQWQQAGLRALADVSGVEGEATTYHAGFLLGPRINAGGRVGRSNLGARLLTSDHPDEVQKIAEELDQLNKERRIIEANVLEAAQAQVESQLIGPETPILIAAGDNWHPGVIGIAAGRVKDRFNRPSLVIGTDPDTGIGKGSGRSCAGVDLGLAISEAREAGLLIAGGGHSMACGLTIESSRIDELHEFLTERLTQPWIDAHAARTLEIDAVVHPAAVNFNYVDALSAAEPFGMGNRQPRFAFSDLIRTYAKRVGKDHVRFTFQAKSGANLSGIAFGVADHAIGQALLKAGDAKFHAVGRLKADNNAYGRRAELHLEDLAEITA